MGLLCVLRARLGILSVVSLGAADRGSWRQLPLLLALFLAAVVGVLQTGTLAPAAHYVEAPASVTAPALSPPAPATSVSATSVSATLAPSIGAGSASDAATERPAVQSPAGAREIDPRELLATPAAVGAQRPLNDQDVHFTRAPRGPPLHLV